MTARFKTEFYPHGRALAVTTNAREVIDQAEVLWGAYPKLSALPAVPVCIRITEDRAVKDQSTCRIQGRRIFFRSSRHDWAIADLTACRGYGTFTRDSLENVAFWRYHFLEPLGCSLIAARHFTLIHASAIAVDGRALILCGDSGAGKTCLAYAASRNRWSFVSGDAVALHRDPSAARITGRPYEIRFRATAADLFPELSLFPAALRPNGKRDIEFDPRELGISTTLESDVAGIVFLQRSPKSAAALQALPSQELIERLSTSICFGNAALREAQRASFQSLLPLPRFRLLYSDLGQAEELLWTLAQQSSRSASG